MGKLSSLGHNLYEGHISFDFVGRRKLWYAISGLIVLFALSGLLVRGLNMGIEFKGGVEFTAKISATQSNVTKMIDATSGVGIPNAADPTAFTSGTDAVVVTTKPLTQTEANKVEHALTAAGATEISQNSIGPSWGKEVANKAETGLIVFLILVVLFIWAYFREWKMSVAAIVALAHDLIITVGVYAWSGFEVTPATVTGLLTILGYSLYDTVVVFDKVRENTRNFATNLTRTYKESANLAVNQTLVRSINTSITAIIPVAAILVVSVIVLGTGPLKDLSLALLVGMAAGTYSSIFIATPLASQLKEAEDAVSAHTKRVLNKRARQPTTAGEVPVVSDGLVVTPSGAAAAPTVRKVAASRQAGRVQPKRPPRSRRKK